MGWLGRDKGNKRFNELSVGDFLEPGELTEIPEASQKLVDSRIISSGTRKDLLDKVSKLNERQGGSVVKSQISWGEGKEI